jgi:c-di-GMP-binding flagellar brake protein YcgR
LKYSTSSDETLEQRRETFRISLGLGNVPIVEFPESLVGPHCFFCLSDLSEGGLGFESEEKVEVFQAGAEFKDCFLEFNVMDRVNLVISIRHVQELGQDQTKTIWRYGCSFEGLSAEDERLVRKNIQARDRKQAQSRSRFV